MTPAQCRAARGLLDPRPGDAETDATVRWLAGERNRVLLPIVARYPQISSLMLADDRGDGLRRRNDHGRHQTRPR